MGYPVTHFEIVGKDAVALQKFYGAAFGWEMKQQIPGYAMAMPGAKEGINGGVGAAMNGGPGHVTIYVQVDDVSAALKRVEELGGRMVLPSTQIPSGPTIGLFHDPEGHLVGVAQPAGAQ
jgi:uncharacterized protein